MMMNSSVRRGRIMVDLKGGGGSVWSYGGMGRGLVRARLDGGGDRTALMGLHKIAKEELT